MQKIKANHLHFFMVVKESIRIKVEKGDTIRNIVYLN